MGRWDRSLEVLRRQMFEETKPDAAVFVGGMEGIRAEYELFGEVRAAGRGTDSALQAVPREPWSSRRPSSGPSSLWASCSRLSPERSWRM